MIRAKLITEPDFKAIFYTHISNEFSIAEKKFKLFIKEEHERVINKIPDQEI